MKRIIQLASTLLFATIIFASCNKEELEKPVPEVVIQLTAKTWQVEEVVDNHGTAKVLYKKGAPNNEDDHSLVRQTLRRDGSIAYVDQFGNSGTDGRYQLLENNTKIKLSVEGMGGLSTIAQNLQVSANQFSYRLVDEHGYTQFTFTPVP